MKKIVSLFLAFVMVFAMVPATGVSAYGEYADQITAKNVMTFETDKDVYQPGDTVAIKVAMESIWGDPEIEDDIEGYEGDVMPGAYGMNTLCSTLIYDTSVFTAKAHKSLLASCTITNADATEASVSGNNPLEAKANGAYYLMAESDIYNAEYSGYGFFTGSGDLWEYNLTIAADAAPGTYYLPVGPYRLWDESDDIITPVISFADDSSDRLWTWLGNCDSLLTDREVEYKTGYEGPSRVAEDSPMGAQYECSYVVIVICNHDSGTTYTETVPATCTVNGSINTRCADCDEVLSSEEIAALGHTLVTCEAKVPTCTEIGWDAYEACENCDYSTRIEIAETGHSLVFHEAKEPTATEVGWDAYKTCENCDYTTYVEISARDVEGYYTYAVTDGEATIIGVDSSISGDVVIPDTIGGYPVTSIGELAFAGYDALTSIVIPDSVTSIGTGAFMQCYFLKNITIPESVTGIGDQAFSCCESLTNVTIPDGVTSIGFWAFSDCCSLTTVTIPDSVTMIDHSAFYGCSELNEVFYKGSQSKWDSLTSSVVYLSDAYYLHIGVTDPETHNIVSTVEPTCLNDGYTVTTCSCGYSRNTAIPATGHLNSEIRDAADATTSAEGYTGDTYCTDCGEMIASGEVIPMLPLIGDVNDDGVVNIKDVSLFMKYIAKWEGTEINKTNSDANRDGRVNSLDTTYMLKCLAGWTVHASIEIPETSIDYTDTHVTEIINGFYIKYESMTEDTLTVSLVSRNKDALEISGYSLYFDYSDSMSLTSFEYLGNEYYSINSELLTAKPYQFIAVDTSSIVSSDIDTAVAKLTFSISDLNDIYIKLGLDNNNLPIDVSGSDISMDRFGVSGWDISKTGTPDENGFIIDDDGVLIGYAGEETDVVIPDNVTAIGGFAFLSSSITSIVIPDSVTSIGYGAFCNCTNLTSITIPNSVISIGYSAFQGCARLKDITLSNSVTSIEYNTFYGCSRLKTIIIPDSVTSIDDTAFYDCASLESIIIPDSVTYIGNRVFENCKYLTIYCNTDSVAENYAIDNYIKYDSVNNAPMIEFVIENGVLTEYKGSDSEVTVPDGVTSIGASAFAFNSSVTSVTLPSGVTVIGVGAFSFCPALTTVHLPSTLITIDTGAFAFCSALSEINLPDSVESIGDGAFSFCKSFAGFSSLVSMSYIGEGAFEDCTSLTTLALDDTVETIGADAFSGCENLTLRCYADSAAETYAAENDVSYRAIVLGDANDDNTINATDKAYMRRIMNGSSVDIGYGADVNKDGSVNNLDYTALHRMVKGTNAA